MAITEKLQAYLHKLPVFLQAEVLDFVEHLLTKAEQDIPNRESETWSDLSLMAAMRGMENEEAPSYTTDDLKLLF